jgi:hypothetical protein
MISAGEPDAAAAATIVAAVVESLVDAAVAQALGGDGATQAMAGGCMSTPLKAAAQRAERRSTAAGGVAAGAGPVGAARAGELGSACDDAFALEALEVDGPAEEWLSPSSNLLPSRGEPAVRALRGGSGGGAVAALLLRSNSWQAYVDRMSASASASASASPSPERHAAAAPAASAAAAPQGARPWGAFGDAPTPSPDSVAGLPSVVGAAGGTAAENATTVASAAWASSLRSPFLSAAAPAAAAAAAGGAVHTPIMRTSSSRARCVP